MNFQNRMKLSKEIQNGVTAGSYTPTQINKMGDGELLNGYAEGGYWEIVGKVSSMRELVNRIGIEFQFPEGTKDEDYFRWDISDDDLYVYPYSEGVEYIVCHLLMADIDPTLCWDHKIFDWTNWDIWKSKYLHLIKL